MHISTVVILASLCNRVGWFEPNLVLNSEYRFSHTQANMYQFYHGLSFSEWIILCTGGKAWYNYSIPPYISVDPEHHEIFRAKVGKGGIKWIALHLLHQSVWVNLLAHIGFPVKNFGLVPSVYSNLQSWHFPDLFPCLWELS